MSDTTSETEEEEIEEYELVETPLKKGVEEERATDETPKKQPEKTKITRDKKIKGLDYCPFCDSENLGKDHKKGIYVCLDCGGTYKVVES